MNTEIIDKRGKIINTHFSDIEVGEFFQDTDEENWNPDDLICMKTSRVTVLRFRSNGRIEEENWEYFETTFVIPLKATITVERGE